MPERDFDPTEQLERARAFVKRGWRVFPIGHGGKRPFPRWPWGQRTAEPAADPIIVQWFGDQPVNIAIAVRGSNLVVIDEDREGGFAELAAAYGQVVPDTYRVRTANGWHYYFQAPDDLQIGNSGALKKDFGLDVRGPRGADKEAGGYVVAHGSLHASGVVYTAEDPDADEVPLPWWLGELIAYLPEEGGEAPPLGEPDPLRRFTTSGAKWYAEQQGITPLRAARQGERNTMLNRAAMVMGHFVGQVQGWTYERVTKQLAKEARLIGLDLDEIGPTIASGLAAGMRHLYTVDDTTVSTDGEDDGPDALEIEVGRRLRDLKVNEEAHRRLRLEKRAERPSIASGVLDDLDAVVPPAMLLDELIPELSVGFLAGRSGAYKSFLAVAWAFAIATGTSWGQFKVAKPLKTLYVAAEGPGGAAGRMKAWEARTGISRAGKLLLYPRPVHLNDEDQAEELGDVLREGEYGFLVVDTYHRSAPGTEENDATEFGTVFDAVARFRDELGVGVLFVDHTGHSVDGRPRGTSAKGDDADYVLTASYAGDTRGPEVQRTLRVIKLKDQEENSEGWSIGLAMVTDDDGDPVYDTFPVVTIRDAVDGELFAPPEWWEGAAPPDDLVERLTAASDRKRGVKAALLIWRLLTAIGEGAAHTAVQLRQMLNEMPGEEFKGSTVRAAVLLLVKAEVAGKDNEKIFLLGKDDLQATL